MSSLSQFFIAFWRVLGSIFRSRTTSPESRMKMTLEQQLAALADLGFRLNKGITVDDLLYSFDRGEYENKPFGTVLFMLGSEVEREPWGRNICDRAWNFDVEFIEDDGAYVTIVQNLCRVAGTPQLITEIRDFIDFEDGKAWLKYMIDGKSRHYDVAVDDDWADAKVVGAVMEDIERDGMRFYAKDNGQASIWFYLDSETARKLSKLTGQKLKTNR